MNDNTHNILLCSQDPIFIKGLYGPLRDSGYRVETIEHPADAIKCVFSGTYLSVILDSRDIGITASDAATIIKTVKPETHIIVIGKDVSKGDLCIMMQPDALDQLKKLIQELSLLRLKTQSQN